MHELYESRLGEIKTKEEWLMWADTFYERINTNLEVPFKQPKNIWQRMQKVLRLTLVTDLIEK